MGQASSLLRSTAVLMQSESLSFEERLQVELKAQRKRLENLVTICVLLLMLATLWMMIPDLTSAMADDHP